MPNARARIALTEDELDAYFETQKTLIMATHNHDGYPHVVPMWFTMIDGLVHMHTYKTSQKVVNVERDPRGAVLVEDGVVYSELRGVYVRGRFEIVDDQDLCYRVGIASAQKYMGVTEEEGGEGVRLSVRKRVVIIFHPDRLSSWDHRKI